MSSTQLTLIEERRLHLQPLQELTAVYHGERFRWDETIVGDVELAESGQLAESASNQSKHRPGRLQMVSVKGPSAVDELQLRQTYRFYGRWSEYKNKRTQLTEKQFHFETFVRCQPHGRSGIINYLKTAPHIGQKTAETLWEKFGGDAVRILRESPDVAAAAVNAAYFSPLRAAEASQHLEQEQALEGCTIDLIDALHGRGFPKNTARAAVARWGNRAAEIIKRCPYYLMNFRGCGFLKTDAMYLDLGLPPGKLKRQALCAWHAVASDTSGDVWYPVEFVEGALRKKISGAAVAPVGALTLAKRGRLIATRRDDQGRLWIAEAVAAGAERRISESLAEAEPETPSWPAVASIPGTSDHQRESLQHALQRVVSILCGAPGTGKTFTAAGLIKLLVSEVGADFVAVAAPTGKAAVRVTEHLSTYGVPIVARTIHSLLGVQSSDDSSKGQDTSSSWSFEHNEHNPLPYRFVIVDESSMIDNSLMSCLLSARAKGTHILFVGDVNQLPPVGRGAPLRDMTAAGIPCGELTEIRRNSGAIVRACHAIKNGQRFNTSAIINLDADDPENLYLVSAGNPQQQVNKMLVGIEAGKRDGLDPVWDCQVLVGVNAKSELSRQALNKVLQERLNASGEQANGNPFRAGDKIVCLKNGFLELDGERASDSSDDPDSDDKVYVANGELAEVLSVREKLTIARLTNPLRIVKIPRGNGNGNSNGKEAESESASDTGCSWDLGYALSVHKSQGSEWPLVIVMLDEYPGARLVCSREWIYTAISRARRLCLLVGKLATATGMCRRQALGKRKTFLTEQVAEQRLLLNTETGMEST